MSEMTGRVAIACAPIIEEAVKNNWPEGTMERLARTAIEAVREPLLAIIAKEEQDFLSPEYATGQPLSSLSERFACREVAKAIAAALSPSREDGK